MMHPHAVNYSLSTGSGNDLNYDMIELEKIMIFCKGAERNHEEIETGNE